MSPECFVDGGAGLTRPSRQRRSLDAFKHPSSVVRMKLCVNYMPTSVLEVELNRADVTIGYSGYMKSPQRPTFRRG